MYKFLRITIWIAWGFSSVNGWTQEKTAPFVTCNGTDFSLGGQPYRYVGANYWYGSLLALTEDAVNGKQRLREELDFLQQKGITNLRVLAGGEGQGMIDGRLRVTPALQPQRGFFAEENLKALDFLLDEMRRRNMKAVLYVSNNWEWSGGWLQYLNWHGKIQDSVMRRKLNWDEFRDYGSMFYDCKDCKNDYLKQLQHLLGRTNSISHLKYINDPAIMAWELANEPRPMRSAAIPAFERWIREVAAYIRSSDKNHLITLGTEGSMGVENLDVFKAIHSGKNIDYLTIHIWPKNWGWLRDTAMDADFSSVLTKTDKYLQDHAAVAKDLNKPLVIEEFGMPRDGGSFNPSAAVTFRDKYYQFIFSRCFSGTTGIAGCNFWAFSGKGRPIDGQFFWKEGDVYLGDPPAEEQGLNSVFDTDESTWTVIESFTQKCKK